MSIYHNRAAGRQGKWPNLEHPTSNTYLLQLYSNLTIVLEPFTGTL